MMRSPKQIVIGYTTRLFGESLESMVGGFGGFTVSATISLWEPLRDFMKSRQDIDIVLLELCMPKKCDIINISTIRESHPGCKIFLLSHLPQPEVSSRLIEAGIDAFMLKSCSRNDMITAFGKLAENRNFFCSDITMAIMNSDRASKGKEIVTLTAREKEILTDLVNCRTNYQIAVKLGLSENTVKAHRKNIQNKFGVNNLLGMVRFACRSNLIDFGQDEFCMQCPHYAQ